MEDSEEKNTELAELWNSTPVDIFNEQQDTIIPPSEQEINTFLEINKDIKPPETFLVRKVKLPIPPQTSQSESLFQVKPVKRAQGGIAQLNQLRQQSSMPGLAIDDPI